MINVSQDIEFLLQTKQVLHDTIFGNSQLRGCILYIIYNKQPELIKKGPEE